MVGSNTVTVNVTLCCDEVVVTNVTSLLKTVKTVEDEAARGTQALESSIEAISQEMKVLAVISGHIRNSCDIKLMFCMNA